MPLPATGQEFETLRFEGERFGDPQLVVIRRVEVIAV